MVSSDIHPKSDKWWMLFVVTVDRLCLLHIKMIQWRDKRFFIWAYLYGLILINTDTLEVMLGFNFLLPLVYSSMCMSGCLHVCMNGYVHLCPNTWEKNTKQSTLAQLASLWLSQSWYCGVAYERGDFFKSPNRKGWPSNTFGLYALKMVFQN